MTNRAPAYIVLLLGASISVTVAAPAATAAKTTTVNVGVFANCAGTSQVCGSPASAGTYTSSSDLGVVYTAPASRCSDGLLRGRAPGRDERLHIAAGHAHDDRAVAEGSEASRLDGGRYWSQRRLQLRRAR